MRSLASLLKIAGIITVLAFVVAVGGIGIQQQLSRSDDWLEIVYTKDGTRSVYRGQYLGFTDVGERAKQMESEGCTIHSIRYGNLAIGNEAVVGQELLLDYATLKP